MVQSILFYRLNTHLSVLCFHPVLQLSSELLLLLSQSLQYLLQLLILFSDRGDSTVKLLQLLCGGLSVGCPLRQQTVSLGSHAL